MTAPEIEPRKGLSVDFWRHASHGDCSLNGVSARHSGGVVVGIVHRDTFTVTPELPRQCRPASERADRPALWLQLRTVFGKPSMSIIPALPVDQQHDKAALTAHLTRWMFGGNFAYTSDDRWRSLMGTPFSQALAVHDRTEW